MLTTILNYKVISLIGQGGMGKVYKCYDPFLDRYIAVKTINLDQFINKKEVLKARFFIEAQAAAKSKHPGIVTIYQVGEDDNNNLFIAMEFLDGFTLNDTRFTYKYPYATDILTILKKIAHALKIAHDQNIIHRDIKPANIVMTEHQPVITDFGIAHLPGSTLTMEGDQLGSPIYMSPEQLSGSQSIDNRSDLYSLGILLFELLMGELPFSGNNLAQILTEIADPNSRLKKLDLGDSDFNTNCGHIYNKLSAHHPSDRYSDASDLCHDIDELLKQSFTSGLHTGASQKLSDTQTKDNCDETICLNHSFDISKAKGPAATKKTLSSTPSQHSGPINEQLCKEHQTINQPFLEKTSSDSSDSSDSSESIAADTYRSSKPVYKKKWRMYFIFIIFFIVTGFFIFKIVTIDIAPPVPTNPHKTYHKPVSNPQPQLTSYSEIYSRFSDMRKSLPETVETMHNNVYLTVFIETNKKDIHSNIENKLSNIPFLKLVKKDKCDIYLTINGHDKNGELHYKTHIFGENQSRYLDATFSNEINFNKIIDNFNFLYSIYLAEILKNNCTQKVLLNIAGNATPSQFFMDRDTIRICCNSHTSYTAIFYISHEGLYLLYPTYEGIVKNEPLLPPQCTEEMEIYTPNGPEVAFGIGYNKNNFIDKYEIEILPFILPVFHLGEISVDKKSAVELMQQLFIGLINDHHGKDWGFDLISIATRSDKILNE